MVRLCIFELKKLGSSRFLVRITILLMLVCLFLCNRSIQVTPEQKCLDQLVRRYQSNPEEILQYLEQMESRSVKNSSDYPQIYSDLPDYNDVRLFRDFKSLLTQEEEYEKRIAGVIRSLNYQKAEVTMSSGYGSYAAKRVERLLSLYEKSVVDARFSVERPKGWDVLFSFESLSVILSVVTILGASLVYTSDHSGQLLYVGMTRRGRKDRMIAKFFASCLYGLAVSVAFLVPVLVWIGARCGFSDWNVSLASLEMFQYEPYGFTIRGFFWLFLASKCLSAVMIAAFAGVVSLFFRNSISVCAVGALLPGVNDLIFLLSKSPAAKGMNLFGFMHLSPLFERYYSLNCFGHLADAPLFFLFFILFLWALCCLLYGLMAERCAIRSPVGHLTHKAWAYAKGLMERKKGPPAGKNSLFGTELFKATVVSRIMPFVMVLLLVSVYLSSSSFHHTETIEQTMVKEYITALRPLCEEEKAEWIQKERERIDDAIGKSSTMNQEFREGSVSSKEYSEYLDELNYAKKHDIALGKIEEQWSYVMAQREQGIAAELIYDAEWLVFFGNGINYPAVAGLILLGTFLFAQEYPQDSTRTGWMFLLRSTPNGRRKIFWVKIKVALLFGVVLFALTAGVDLLFASHRLALEDFGAPIASVRLFAHLRLPIRIGGFIVLRYLVQLFGFLLTAIVSCLLGLRLKNQFFSVFLALLVLLIPYMGETAGMAWCRFFELALLLDGTKWFVWIGPFYGQYVAWAMAGLLLLWLFGTLIVVFASERGYSLSPNQRGRNGKGKDGTVTLT